MPVINGIKFACAPCMRGHRSSKCTHSDRVLVKVRKPGRPLSACPHAAGPDAFVHSSPGSIEKEKEKENTNGTADGTKPVGKCPTGECGCNSSVTSVAIPNVASCSCGSNAHTKPSEETPNEHETVTKTNGCGGGYATTSPLPTPAHKVAKRGSVSAKKQRCVFYEGAKGEMAEKFLGELESQASEEDGKTATAKHHEHEANGTGVEYNAVGNGAGHTITSGNAITNGNAMHHHDLFPTVETQLGFDGTFNTDIFSQPIPPQRNGGSCCCGNHSNGHLMGLPPTSPTSPTAPQHNGSSSSNGIHSNALHSPFAVPLSPSFFPTTSQYQFTAAPDIMQQLPTSSWSYNANPPQSQNQTITATLTPQEMAWLLKARASGFFALNQNSTPQPTTTSIAAPQPRLRAAGSCVCGDACTCIGCADHPYNPRMLGYVKELSQMTQQSSQSQGSTPMATTPTLSFNAPGQNLQQGGSCCGGGSNGGNHGGNTRFAESDAASPEAPEVTMSPSDYMIVDYTLGSCSSVENGCMCGDGCMCLGCLTHSGHDGGTPVAI